jgi:hypothetical protein
MVDGHRLERRLKDSDERTSLERENIWNGKYSD